MSEESGKMPAFTIQIQSNKTTKYLKTKRVMGFRELYTYRVFTTCGLCESVTMSRRTSLNPHECRERGGFVGGKSFRFRGSVIPRAFLPYRKPSKSLVTRHASKARSKLVDHKYNSKSTISDHLP